MNTPKIPSEKSSFLPRISVTRPVTVTMCLLALLVIGLVAYSRISVQLFPSGFTPRFLWVNIRYPNATPQEAEQQVARPLEEALGTVKGLKRIRTYSASWRVGAPLEFESDTDMDMAYNQVMDRLERLKPDLPEQARDNVFLWKYNEEGDQEIMWIGVAVDSSIADPYRFLQNHVSRPLERIDGVAKVDFWGVYEKEVMVEVDRERMQIRDVSTFELVQALQQDNFALAGGRINEGEKKLYVRSMARYRDLEEIGNVRIPTRNGEVRLKDVADILYDAPDRYWRQRIDGQPAASIEIKRESGANIVDVCRRVEAALKEIEARPATANLRFNIFFNQGQFIDESIRNLRNTALWGGLFAALVLLFFLRAVRMTAIITLSIPLCIMLTLIGLYFINWSLNMVTMMGLMVGVGMVVDNAIVILENIYRKREAGQDARTASIYGASEVALAVTMATLTTVVVFLPLMLMGGNDWLSFYLTRIGVPVVIALLGSLFVALIFIPLSAVHFGGGVLRTDFGTIRRLRNRYERTLAWALRHRRDTLLIALAIFSTVFYASSKVKKSDSTRSNINDIRINVDTPDYFSLEEISGVLEEMEVFLKAREEQYGIRTMRVSYSRHRGRIHVFLDTDPNQAWWYIAYRDLRKTLGIPVDKRMDRRDVIEHVAEHLPRFVGVETRVDRSGGGGRDPSIGLYLYGDDTEVLAGMLTEVERRLRTIPAVVSVDSDLERDDDEVRVHVDRELAQRYGISPQMVARSISFALQGVNLPRFQTEDREIRTRLYLREEDRQSLNQLRNLTFRARSGEEVPLSTLATLEIAPGSGTIRRENGKTRMEVRAFTTRQDIKKLYLDIDKAMDGFEMPRGYSWDKGERYSSFRESDNDMFYAIVLAITCVFLLMGVLFESFLLPFCVLFSIPFAFLGVYWTLYLTGTPFDMMARIGLIVLIGVVVNNAIVLVDTVNRLRNEGMDRTQALLESATSRFRPILMTTFTTVFGLLPMAVGNANLIGMPYAPLGRTMMGGLLASTLLTLFAVPLFYTFLDDLRLTLIRIATATFSHPTPTVPADRIAADD
ncbi:MAG: efflux RND transporter permease subunit [bacterium]|nr:efflux RND transporter permease subunit [bacterium]